MEEVILIAPNLQCDWLVMLRENFTFSTLDTIRQRLIPPFRTHFACKGWGQVAFRFISHTHPVHIRHIVHKYVIIILTSVVGGGGVVFYVRCPHADREACVWGQLWLIMDPGHPCHFSSHHICRSLPLQQTSSVWKCNTLQSIIAQWSSVQPLSISGLTGLSGSPHQLKPRRI